MKREVRSSAESEGEGRGLGKKGDTGLVGSQERDNQGNVVGTPGASGE